MSKPINAGLLSSIKKFLDGFGSWLTESGVEVENRRDLDGGKAEYTLRPDKDDPDDKLIMQSIPVEGEENAFNIQFIRQKSGSREASAIYRNVAADDVQNTVSEVIENWWGDDQEDSASKTLQKASKELKLGLSKVLSSESTDIYVDRIYSNYDAENTLIDLNLVTANPEFIATIPTDCTSYYSVTTDDSGDLDVNPCEEFVVDELQYLKELHRNAYALNASVKFMQYNAAGPSFSSLKCSFDGLYYSSETLVSLLSTALLSLTGFVEVPRIDDLVVKIQGPIHAEESASYVQDMLNNINQYYQLASVSYDLHDIDYAIGDLNRIVTQELVRITL